MLAAARRPAGFGAHRPGGPARRAGGCRRRLDPLRPAAAAFRARGQARHLPLHDRRRLPRRYLRPQAEALRPTTARRSPSTTGRASSAQFKRFFKRPQLGVPPRRRVRDRGQRPVPARPRQWSTTCASSARWRRTTPTTTKPRSACTPGRSPSPGPASARGSATAWAPRTATCRRSWSSPRTRPMPARRPGGPTSCPAAIRARTSSPARRRSPTSSAA